MQLEFHEKLGRGAFAHVWRATDALGRSVAVKFFSEPTASQAAQQALTHARALARVNHPAVVRVLAVEEQPHPETNEQVQAVVMDLIPGASLSMRRESITPVLAATIVRNISGGLQAIHDQNLIHGDLHDANLMVHDQGATILDILYTHSLAEVGTRTAQRSRAEDLRDLAKLCRQVCERALVVGPEVAEAFYLSDTSTSCADVAAPFLELLERRPTALAESLSVNAPLSVSAVAPTQTANRGVLLLKEIQQESTLLSSVLPSVLEFALETGNEKLATVCQRELVGYERAPGDPSHVGVEESEARHRVLLFLVSYNLELNIDYFGGARLAIRYMQEHPTEFVPCNILYPAPLTGIERMLGNDRGDWMVQLTMAAGMLIPTAESPSTPVRAYAHGDELGKMVDRIRARLVELILAGGLLSGPQRRVRAQSAIEAVVAPAGCSFDAIGGRWRVQCSVSNMGETPFWVDAEATSAEWAFSAPLLRTNPNLPATPQPARIRVAMPRAEGRDHPHVEAYLEMNPQLLAKAHQIPRASQAGCLSCVFRIRCRNAAGTVRDFELAVVWA